MDNVIRVQMLGRFTVSGSLGQIDDSQNRSKKVWALMALLICNHGRVVTPNTLIELLWNEDTDSVNPAGALKTTLHRARALLDQISPLGGHHLILNKNGGYIWNEDVPLEIDAEIFDKLCRTTSENDEDHGLANYRQALALYQGMFLNKLSSESWVIAQSTYYHNLYIQTVNRALELMETSGLWNDAELLCRSALRLEPYQEELYRHLMRNLLALGRQSEAASVFEDMSKLLQTNFGVMPDQESRRLYREALQTVNRRGVPACVIQEQLREVAPITGALVCDYDYFKIIYQAEARMVVRSGNAVHIALFTLRGRSKELATKSLQLAMDNLEEMLKQKLRKGDVITRCSPSQFLFMLPQANYENSVMVCGRILKAFYQKYPHTPVTVEQEIYALEPSTTAPAMPNPQ